MRTETGRIRLLQMYRGQLAQVMCDKKTSMGWSIKLSGTSKQLLFCSNSGCFEFSASCTAKVRPLIRCSQWSVRLMPSWHQGVAERVMYFHQKKKWSFIHNSSSRRGPNSRCPRSRTSNNARSVYTRCPVARTRRQPSLCSRRSASEPLTVNRQYVELFMHQPYEVPYRYSQLRHYDKPLRDYVIETHIQCATFSTEYGSIKRIARE